uniref:Uncharacterized protein n=1 Tax=Octopus bimaculoides TaxID=37653 RepID=A0A0L8H315_OCTBM
MSRNISSHRSGTCTAAKNVVKKYKRKYRIAGDNSIDMVWLSYLKFLEMFSKDLREYAVQNQIKKYTPLQINKLYIDKMEKYKK